MPARSNDAAVASVRNPLRAACVSKPEAVAAVHASRLLPNAVAAPSARRAEADRVARCRVIEAADRSVLRKETGAAVVVTEAKGADAAVINRGFGLERVQNRWRGKRGGGERKGLRGFSRACASCFGGELVLGHVTLFLQ